ncbi:MAG: hypothetical protein UV38_C0003G0035 [candidate division TM6 bacterium GW2011_GWE2_42_60]|nr:MAG: hypothetical protein UV38_C0003G0035 [candidate division TM6 bacterium GW2011_GWE2_42_60]HBY05483.1 DUF167 domain-containing protein [Candidatus Dependentiae bacterium]
MASRNFMKITIKVIPRSGRQLFSLTKEGVLKCYLQSPPEGGRANKELIDQLSEALDIPRRAMCIVQGATSRTKVVEIEGLVSIDEVWERLGLGLQKTIV